MLYSTPGFDDTLRQQGAVMKEPTARAINNLPGIGFTFSG